MKNVKEVKSMNQILATSEATSKKKRSGPADIKTVVKVFAIVMIMFGVFMIGTGSYAIYKDRSYLCKQLDAFSREIAPKHHNMLLKIYGDVAFDEKY